MTKAKKSFINKMWICLDKVYTVSPPSLFSFPPLISFATGRGGNVGGDGLKAKAVTGVWRDT